MRLCLRDCDPAAPQGALNLIKGTGTFTFTQHLERKEQIKQSILFPKHKTSVLCVSYCHFNVLNPAFFLSLSVSQD